MKLSMTRRAVTLAAIVIASGVTTALAQGTTSDPHRPDTHLIQTAPDAAGQPDMMSPRKEGQGMMGQGVNGMPMMPMRGSMMRIVFAIADANVDGGISFDELTTIHKRIFDKVDVNKDGKITPDEIEAFMRE